MIPICTEPGTHNASCRSRRQGKHPVFTSTPAKFDNVDRGHRDKQTGSFEFPRDQIRGSNTRFSVYGGSFDALIVRLGMPVLVRYADLRINNVN